MAFNQNGGAAFVRAIILSGCVFACFVGVAAVFHPDTPLPDAWNPTKPLNVDDPYTALTDWKLANDLSDPAMCRAALAQVAIFKATGPKPHENPNCNIENTVIVNQIDGVKLGGLETDCQTALRTAMWISFELAPASQRVLGKTLTRIDQLGSHSCRQIRTVSGNGGRMSTHATAMAIDVSGFRFDDGTRIRLIEDWDDPTPRGEYLHVVRDGACDWFRTTLSPDYNGIG